MTPGVPVRPEMVARMRVPSRLWRSPASRGLPFPPINGICQRLCRGKRGTGNGKRETGNGNRPIASPAASALSSTSVPEGPQAWVTVHPWVYPIGSPFGPSHPWAGASHVPSAIPFALVPALVPPRQPAPTPNGQTLQPNTKTTERWQKSPCPRSMSFLIAVPLDLFLPLKPTSSAWFLFLVRNFISNWWRNVLFRCATCRAVVALFPVLRSYRAIPSVTLPHSGCL
jgi:hypothetical protein